MQLSLANASRAVVKIGSALLADPETGALNEDLARRPRAGRRPASRTRQGRADRLGRVRSPSGAVISTSRKAR